MRRFVLVCLFGVACSSAPSKHAQERPAAPPPAAAPAPNAEPAGLPSGWLSSNATALGGRVGDASIALVGGRRMAIRDDGTVEAERVPSPYPLERLVVVPTAKGPVVTAASSYRVFRFDDPLGEGRLIHTSSQGIEGLGSVPGGVLVAPEGALVDVNLARSMDSATVATLPPMFAVFTTLQRGVALFPELGGAYDTLDGGKTWQRIATLQSMPISGFLEARAGGALLRVNRPYVASDVVLRRASSGPEPPLVAWLDKTMTDPLGSALSHGARYSDHEAITASDGMAAIVDLSTGNVTQTLGLDVDEDGDCRAVRLPTGFAAVCQSQERTAIVELETSGGALALGRVTKVRAVGGVVTGAGGGLAIRGRCNGERRSSLCVRQPDGSFVTQRGSLPRADGTALDIDGNDVRVFGRPDGTSPSLVHLPVEPRVRSVSEDDLGVLWLLAVTGARYPEDPQAVWTLGRVDDGAISWSPLGPAMNVAHRGQTVVAVGGGTVRVRTRAEGPWREAPSTLGSELEVHELGFSGRGEQHLGFDVERRPAAEPEPPPEPPRSTSKLVCASGPPRAFADRGLFHAPEGGFSQGWSSGSLPEPTIAVKLDARGLSLRWIDTARPFSTVREGRITWKSIDNRGMREMSEPVVRGDVLVTSYYEAGALALVRIGRGSTEVASLGVPGFVQLHLGEDGAAAAVLDEFGTGTLWHWPVRGKARPLIEIGTDDALASVDASGLDLLQLGTHHGARGRVEAKSAAGTPRLLTLGDFSPLPHSLLIGSTHLPRCGAKPSGVRSAVKLRRLLDSAEVDGRSVEISGGSAELIVGATEACVASLAVVYDQGSTVARVNFVSSKADVLTVGETDVTTATASCTWTGAR